MLTLSSLLPSKIWINKFAAEMDSILNTKNLKPFFNSNHILSYFPFLDRTNVKIVDTIIRKKKIWRINFTISICPVFFGCYWENNHEKIFINVNFVLRFVLAWLQQLMWSTLQIASHACVACSVINIV